MDLRFCEIKEDYINYLHECDSLVPLPKKENQINNRKYIGVLLKINDFDYYVNLSSYKPKHDNLKESIDFIKIKQLCVINLNNMIPVPENCIIEFDINSQEEKYKKLLLAERRAILSKKNEIYKKSRQLYNYKCNHNNDTPLAKRCCDFRLLETYAENYNNDVALT